MEEGFDPPEDLREALRRGRLVVVVGAGVSMAATEDAACASWKGLLADGVERCRKLRREEGTWSTMGSLLKSEVAEHMRLVAEAVSAAMGAPKGRAFAAWLRETVGSLRATHVEVLQALRTLRESGAIITTTNYDSLLEDVMRETAPGLPSYTWRDSSDVRDVLRGKKAGILHLHGHWQQPRTVVLGGQSYYRIVGHKPTQNVLRSLATLNTYLFVGCGEGLADPNFGHLLEWMGDLLKGSDPHYRLALEHECDELQRRHQGQPIRVIPYGTRRAHLAPFLLSLGSMDPRHREPRELVPTVAVPLPGRPDCFGRESELRTLAGELLSDAPRPVPVLGPPGIGKRTLALAALHLPAVAERYGPRRYLVGCEAVRTRADLVAQMAATLAVHGSDGHSEAQVLASLAEAPTVLVLDHLDPPLAAPPSSLEDLLAALASTTGLALIVTNDGLLLPNIPGRQWLKPAVTLGPLRPPAAREAFLKIAEQRLSRDPHLRELLAGVDHVPFAVCLLARLAAGAPSLQWLCERWRSERSGAPGGHGPGDEMAPCYELAIRGDRVTEEARGLLSLLGDLPDGVAWASLDRLLPGEGCAAATILCQVGLAYNQCGRLRSLAPVRRYVQSRHPPDPGLRSRMIEHYLALARLGAEAGEVGGREAVEGLKREAGNIESVLRSAIGDPRYADRALAAMAAWAQFVRIAGIGWRDPPKDHRFGPKPHHPLLTANWAWSLAEMALARADYQSAAGLYHDAWSIYRQERCGLGLANCAQGLGDTALAQARHGEAERHYQQARGLYEQEGDVAGWAHCTRSLGDVALRCHDYVGARGCYEEALTRLSAERDACLARANCHQSLGDLELARACPSQAEEQYSRARDSYDRVCDRLGQANLEYRLGELAIQHGELGESKGHIDRAAGAYREVGSETGEAACLRRLGDVRMELGDAEGAAGHYARALRLFRNAGSAMGQAHCERGLGDAAHRSGDLSAARAHYEVALSLYDGDRADLWRARVENRLGDVALAGGDPYAAWQQYERAGMFFARIGSADGLADSARGHGDVATLEGDLDAAERHYGHALALCRHAGEGGNGECRERPDRALLAGMLRLARASARESPARTRRLLAALHRTASPWLAEQISLGTALLRASLTPDLAADLRAALPLAQTAAQGDGLGWDVALTLEEACGDGGPVAPLAASVVAVGENGVRITATASSLPHGLYRLAVRFVAEGVTYWSTERLVSNREPCDPYPIDAPVTDPARLFGRAALLDAIRNHLATASVLLIGPPRSGKTSILRCLPTAVTGDRLPVYVDLQAAGGARQSLSGGIRAALAHACGQADPPWPGWNQLPRMLSHAGVTRLLLLLDGIAPLADHPQLASRVLLLSRWCSPDTRLVLCGTPCDHSRLGNALAGVPGAARLAGFACCEVEPISDDDARVLIEAPLRGCYRWEPDALARVVALGAGRLYVLNVLARLALGAASSGCWRLIDLQHVEEACRAAAGILAFAPEVGEAVVEGA